LYLEKFTNLKLLSLNAIRLKSLDNFPILNLKRVSFIYLNNELTYNLKLDLTDNSISGEELSKLTQYKNLVKLKLSNNPIKTLDEVKKLKVLSNLELLDLTDCPVSNNVNFNEELFKLFPKLKSLNGYSKDGNSVMSSEDENDDNEEDDYEDDEELNENDEEDDDYDDEELEQSEDEDYEDDELNTVNKNTKE
jgi:AP-4 complex subunit epsilon-1